MAALLNDSGSIGGLHLPHRVLMGSMHLALEGPDGDLSRLVDFYRARAAGGAAMIITGGAAVSPEGGGSGYFVLTEPASWRALSAVASAVHEAGSLICLQLFHAGRYALRQETGLWPVAPSAVPTRINPDAPLALTEEQIDGLLARYREAAAAARLAGFDALELMGSEGYLLNQFVAPLTNRRTDRYGGDAQRRQSFPLAVLQAVAHAGLPVIYRLSGLDLVEGGSSSDETLQFAKQLVIHGAAALNVGIGWHESRVPTVAMRVPRGAFAAVGRALRQQVDVPVLIANRINNGLLAAAVLAEGAADFVAPARPFLADPEFANKVLAGTEQRINTCVACNQSCLDRVLRSPPEAASCLVNPAAGREREFRLHKSARPLRVAVVGSGPAGLEAARALAARGHRVDLFEAEGDIGGQLALACRVPGKEEFAETLRYYRHSLAELGVQIRVHHAPSVPELFGYERVVVATGVTPQRPALPGAQDLATYQDVLAGRCTPGRRVVIVGAGGIACDLAEFLVRQGEAPDPEPYWVSFERPKRPQRQVTLLSRGARPAPHVGRSTRWSLLAELRNYGVEMLQHVRYVQLDAHRVRIELDGLERELEADMVVLAAGQRPQNQLWQQLRDCVPTDVIGGARQAEGLSAARAIEEGARLALQID